MHFVDFHAFIASDVPFKNLLTPSSKSKRDVVVRLSGTGI